jgi:hypothetical protein
VGFFAIFLSALLAAIAGIYSQFCVNSPFKPSEYIFEDGKLTLLKLINKTPFGKFTLTSKPQKRYGNNVWNLTIADHASDEEDRKIMTSIVHEKNETWHSDIMELSSQAANTYTVLGYDAACENSEHFVTAPSGHEMSSINVKMSSFGSIVTQPEFPFQAGSSGGGLRNAVLEAELGEVNITSLFSSGSVSITTTADVSNLIDNSRGNVRFVNAWLHNVDVTTKSGGVFSSGMVIRDTDNKHLEDKFKQGRVNITTASGRVYLKQAGDGGDIYITSVSGNINLNVRGSAFSGNYNLQTRTGMVYVNPTNNLHFKGPDCSATTSWSSLPTLRPGVSHLNGHCKQGHAGFKYGQQKIVVYTETGDINLFFEGDEL